MVKSLDFYGKIVQRRLVLRKLEVIRLLYVSKEPVGPHRYRMARPKQCAQSI